MKAIAFLIVFTFVEMMFYCMGAFVAWDFNAGNWPHEGRFMIGVCGTFAAAFVASHAFT